VIFTCDSTGAREIDFFAGANEKPSHDHLLLEYASLQNIFHGDCESAGGTRRKNKLPSDRAFASGFRSSFELGFVAPSSWQCGRLSPMSQRHVPKFTRRVIIRVVLRDR